LQDIYRGHINPDADDEKLRQMAKIIILLLGVITWLICLPRVSTLASLLHFMGAFVASTIWPIIAGLYWRRANAAGAFFAMALGTLIGLWAYFAIGFYVAALVSAAVSMAITFVSMVISKNQFNWELLDQESRT